MAPYAFHPEYSTANPRGNTWSAHTYNVAFSDEIGHFENCLQIDANFNCTTPGAQDQASGLDPDDGNSFCMPGTDSLLVKIDGCFSADGDWDGQSYQKDWPGTNPSPGQDKKLHPTPVMFTSPLTDHGTKNYSTIAFEADLPRIEASDSQDNAPFCDTTTGDNCVNPPNVAIQQASAACCSAVEDAVLSGAGFESGWHPGVAVEEAAECVELGNAPFRGGGEVGLDDSEVGESVEGAPAAS
jgi:hypothetical protein